MWKVAENALSIDENVCEKSDDMYQRIITTPIALNICDVMVTNTTSDEHVAQILLVVTFDHGPFQNLLGHSGKLD